MCINIFLKKQKKTFKIFFVVVVSCVFAKPSVLILLKYKNCAKFIEFIGQSDSKIYLCRIISGTNLKSYVGWKRSRS